MIGTEATHIKLTRNEGLKETYPLLTGTIAETLADPAADHFTADDYEFLKFHGDNIASRSSNTPWWKGPTVLESLDQFKVTDLPKDQPLRFPIQDVYRFDDRRILAGRVEAGSIKTGDKLVFSPTNKTSTVKTIERWNAPSSQSASVGESVGITLTEQIFVARGSVAALESSPPFELSSFKARLFWLGRQPFSKGKTYKIKLATQEAECGIESIEKVIDASTLETVSRKSNEVFVGRHGIDN